MLGAIAEIGRNLVTAESLRATQREVRSFPLARIVGRIGLPRILIDLRFGERAWQPLSLLVYGEPGISTAVAKIGVDAPRGVALPVAAVAPVALCVLV